LLPQKFRKWWLLVASYVFYASWYYPFLALLIAATGINYFGGLWIAQTTERKKRGAIVLAGNVFLLALFKYLDWLFGNINDVASLLGASWQLSLPHWVLPLGISFYLFHCMSYIIDVIRKREKPRGFWDLQLYVAYFPQLIAGPILRVRELLPQFEKKWELTIAHVRQGLWLIVTGLFVKIVLADSLAPDVEKAFGRNYQSLGAIDIYFMAVAFGLQIYFDFSAYTRIAFGSANLCGLQLVENFNYPYSAKSPSDFWNRWHISLSRWIRDYLYFPMVGNKATLFIMCRATLFSMTLCGLWHGAGWTFVLWGAYHGLLICGYQIFTHQKRNSGVTKTQSYFFTKLSSVLSVVMTFSLVSLGWILFRAQNMEQAFGLLKNALTPWSHNHRALGGSFYLRVMLLMLAVWAIPFVANWLGKKEKIEDDDSSLRRFGFALGEGVAMGLMLILCLIYLRGQTSFIYFQF
jgi:alginate O-acetyltransferase complex protein AlgI